MDEITAPELSQIIATALKDKNLQVAGTGQGQAMSRFARLTVQMPNGQMFTVQVEES